MVQLAVWCLVMLGTSPMTAPLYTWVENDMARPVANERQKAHDPLRMASDQVLSFSVQEATNLSGSFVRATDRRVTAPPGAFRGYVLRI